MCPMEESEHYIVERRITERVLRYWENIRGRRDMPEESDIDPDKLGRDWPHCFLLQTRDIDHIEQFNFTYLGDAIAKRYVDSGIDPENLHLIGPNAFYLAPLFKKVVETRKPHIEHNFFYTQTGQKVFFRQCLLPLGTKKKVEAIFGAVLFKLVV